MVHPHDRHDEEAHGIADKLRSHRDQKSVRRLRFGDVAVAAARLPVPDNPRLKPDNLLQLVGRSIPRRDVPAKTDGSAVFGIDVKVPGMVHAAIRHTPPFGGSIESLDVTSVSKDQE
jgi:isoquinoline 1-oxidoreductase subunit beta